MKHKYHVRPLTAKVTGPETMHVQVSFNSCRALLDHSAAADHAEAVAGPSQPRCIRPCDLPHNFAAGSKTKKKNTESVLPGDRPRWPTWSFGAFLAHRIHCAPQHRKIDLSGCIERLQGCVYVHTCIKIHQTIMMPSRSLPWYSCQFIPLERRGNCS